MYPRLNGLKGQDKIKKDTKRTKNGALINDHISPICTRTSYIRCNDIITLCTVITDAARMVSVVKLSNTGYSFSSYVPQGTIYYTLLCNSSAA